MQTRWDSGGSDGKLDKHLAGEFPPPPEVHLLFVFFFFRKDQFLGLNKKKDKHQFLIVIIYFLMPRAAEEQKCTRNAFQTRIVTIPETNNLFITSISKYQDKTPKCRFLNLCETFIHTFMLLPIQFCHNRRHR